MSDNQYLDPNGNQLLDENASLGGNSIFSIEPVQLQFSLVNLLALKACSNILVLALKNNFIYRIDLNNPEFVDKLDLFNGSGNQGGSSGSISNRIKGLYLDPTGNHLIITTVKNVNYYLNKSSKQPVVLGKLKSMNISYIYWNDAEEGLTPSSARNFLIGTTTGQIYESSIEFKSSNNKISNPLVKLIWRNPINKNNTTAIDGIFLKKSSQGSSKKRIAVVVQSDDIFYYKKDEFNSSLSKSQSIFNQLLSGSYSDYEKFDDLGSITGNKFIDNSEDFAWLTKSGIIFTSADNSNSQSSNKLLTQLNYLLNIQLPKSDHATNIYSVLLSKYHIIYLRNNELLVINKINQQMVFHKFLPTFLSNERFLGLCADHREETFWIYSNYNIYELVVSDESKRIWKIYLKNNQFDNALSLVQTGGNKEATNIIKDLILTKKSDYLLNEKQDYQEAAKNYAYTSKPFETVALALLNKNNYDGLLRYLTIKLKLLPTSIGKPNEKNQYFIQKTLISSWIVEIYMEMFNELDNNLSIDKHKEKGTVSDTEKDLKQLKQRFVKFLTTYSKILHKDTVYQIFQSHNDREHLLFYANLINDYDFILNYWINLENWDESLKILEKKNEPSFIYKYSNILLLNSPEKTLHLWTKLYKDLDYKNFAPAILTYNKNLNKLNKKQKITSEPIEKNLILSYLEFLIFRANAIDVIIHNIYLSILVMYPKESSNGKKAETMILKYLETPDDEIHFDPDFILRLFLKFEKFKPAIHVYSILEEYEDAINLALKYNYLNLACLIADRSSENNDLRKKLWLKISERMINQLIIEKVLKQDCNSESPIDKENQVETIVSNDEKYKKFLEDVENNKLIISLINNDDDDIKNLLKYLLSKCELLSIKDILPLFPNFTSVSNFKLEIIKSLESYGIRINQLNNLINSSIKFNNKLIKDLEDLKTNRYYLIEVENGKGLTIQNNSSCQICSNSIFLKKFLVFPCQHCFHIDCLVNTILNSSNKRSYKLKKNLIYHLHKNRINIKNSNINDNNNKVKIGNMTKISKELEEILSAKCVLCSDLNIESIDESFINSSSETDRKLMKEWAL